MSWYKIDDCQIQFNEAVSELRSSIPGRGLYVEAGNKYMNWLQQKLQKICPSPEKLKDFFNGIGQKVDAKVQACKNEQIKNAWNSLKGLFDNLDEEEPEEEEPQQDVEQQEEEEAEEEVAAEGYYRESHLHRYNEGFLDSIKSGWKKLTGGGDEEEQPQPKKRATGAKKTTAKKTTAKKPATKKPITKKPTTKKTTGKNTAVNKSAGKATAKKPSKTGGKKGGKKNQQKKMTKAQVVLQVCKKHWKHIVIVLIACLALYFFGWGIAMLFMKSPVTTKAAQILTTVPKEVASNDGPFILRTAAGVVAGGDAKISDDF